MPNISERDWEREAREMIGYFEPLTQDAQSPEREWYLGLFMAHQWLRLVRQQAPDEAEVALFCRALQSQKVNMGSGWHDLLIGPNHGRRA